MSTSALGLAALASAIVVVGFQETVEVQNLGVLVLKLVPFALALIGISTFPIRSSPLLSTGLLVGSFAVFFCFLVPRLFFHFGRQDWPSFYLDMQVAVPFVILCLALAFRLGGASVKHVLTLGTVLILFMLSGIEDLAFWLVNRPDVGPIPDRWVAASHMTVFVGRPLTKYEAYVFIAIHFVVIAVVLWASLSARTAAFRRRVARALPGLDLR